MNSGNDSPTTKRVEQVAGHQVTRPEKRAGINVEWTKRQFDGDQKNPLADVLKRTPNVPYHVVSKDGGLGVLVTFTRIQQADSWEHTDMSGTAVAKNTISDLLVDLYISSLENRNELPDARAYDPTDDPHAEFHSTIPAVRVFSNERLHREGVDLDGVDRLETLPASQKWYRLNH